jgi:hypothetical protein
MPPSVLLRLLITLFLAAMAGTVAVARAYLTTGHPQAGMLATLALGLAALGVVLALTLPGRHRGSAVLAPLVALIPLLF